MILSVCTNSYINILQTKSNFQLKRVFSYALNSDLKLYSPFSGEKIFYNLTAFVFHYSFNQGSLWM
jgi:hypothetical protein